MTLSLFDSLRDDYVEFDDWYRRVASDGRTAFVIRSDQDARSIAAIAIIKIEHEGEIVAEGKTLSGNFLKICTFKVKDRGLKYGESLLYRLFVYAKKLGCTSVYLQVRNGRHQDLQAFIESFGFERFGEYKADVSYVKRMFPEGIMDTSTPELRVNYVRRFYPLFDDSEDVRKFLVAVSSEVHDHLFPSMQPSLFDAQGTANRSWSEVNAIKKILIENVGWKSIRDGDLLFFYRKGRRPCERYVRCAGVVENIEKCRSLGEIANDTFDRLSYTKGEILELIRKNRYVILVSFFMLPFFDEFIYKSRLTELGIETNHRNIRLLSENNYINAFRDKFEFVRKDVGLQERSPMGFRTECV